MTPGSRCRKSGLALFRRASAGATMWRGAGSGMTRRTASWIAWPACGLAVAASAGSLALRFAKGVHSPSIQAFSLLTSLAFPVIGAVIATRRPGRLRDAIGAYKRALADRERVQGP